MKWNASAANPRSGIITVLDVGSSKVCCIIAKLKPREESPHLPGRTHQVRILGLGHQKSVGVKSGMVIELDRAEQAIRLAVDAAERMAGVTVDSLIVNLSAGRMRSEKFSADIELGGHEANESDVKRVLTAGGRQALRNERQIVHSLATGFSLDGERGVRDPRGLVGDRLGVDMHIVSADASPIRNLEFCVNRSHLSVERMVATPYASGLAALVDDESEMGAACIDMGGGTTTFSVFSEGRFVHSDVLPIGGHHVTMDLARGLSTSLEQAERLKVLTGSALPVGGDERETVNVQPIGNDDTAQLLQIPRTVVNRIVRARIEETLEMIRDRLTASGYSALVGRRIVLTGGASQLPGLAEAARRILGRNVRLGRPLGVSGLPEAMKGPAFSTTVGLLIYPQVAGYESRVSAGGFFGWRGVASGGRLQRVGRWLKDSF
ncbi:cell division protein FtsA [Chelativorans sp. ZYF759]|uniref:cell division protein FtsA n=1 Tax=Chelativorans sp. ZYF759 TaxID=2692213 RepID=UPI00145F248B|nr:cell division protein FtsA [Chelativorans sp. ZYF759]NMG41501.1 cell division protein FtsA [Chelativorans sp. ZYF759]